MPMNTRSEWCERPTRGRWHREALHRRRLLPDPHRPAFRLLGGGMSDRAYHQEYGRRWYQANRERRREQMARWRAANPEKVSGYNRRARENAGRRWRDHGITREIAEVMFESQGRACAGCKTPAERLDALSVDHDHSCCTGRWSCGRCVRALLCQSCNAKDVLGEGPRSVEAKRRAGRASVALAERDVNGRFRARGSR